MKNSHLLIPFIFLCLIGGLFGKKPNIVIVITDDQGYGDLSCFGSDKIRTPHIDQLASMRSRVIMGTVPTLMLFFPAGEEQKGRSDKE